MPAIRWTTQRRRTFLVTLAESGNVSAAVRAAEVSRSRAYVLKATDPAFAAAWDDALEAAVDHLEAEARHRAIDGVEQPHFHQGKVCGTVRKYSDALLMFLLRAHRPETYRDRTEARAGAQDDDRLAQEVSNAHANLEERLARLDTEHEAFGAEEDDGGTEQP